ncbi:MAG: zinc ribbon domain-containing protein [Clostridiales bacterium]|nr:zinc ribbon domain-containing protein [Clostridiales bacterium]
MFFIGIFGIEQKSKIIATRQDPCPICGGYGQYDVIKSYNYFHIFFLPLWRWNIRYYIETGCCKRLCSLDNNIGGRIEKGEAVEIHQSDLHCSENSFQSTCPRCSSQLDPDFLFCPYCGNRTNK